MKDRVFELVPAVKRLALHRVGCWEDLILDFCPGLNILTEEGSALGKTSIFQAILYALHPTSRPPDTLSPTSGFPQGRITVEFMSPTHTVDLFAADPLSARRHPQESSGEFLLRQLRCCLDNAQPGSAVLVEDVVTQMLDLSQYGEAVRLLNASHCQVICQIAHRLRLSDFPAARVYACYLDDRGKAQMKLQQAGDGRA